MLTTREEHNREEVVAVGPVRPLLLLLLAPAACTTRCMLYWERGSRYARLIKSPNLPDMIVPYEITADGVVDAQDALAGAAAS